MAPNKSEFVISRTLDAPRERVWKAFTEVEQMKQWWGPKGFTVTQAKMDLRPGGTFHYALRSPEGQDMWGKFVYREIVAPERIVFVSFFSDEQGGVTRHPMAPSWPLQMLSTFTFVELGGKTDLCGALGAARSDRGRAQDLRRRARVDETRLDRHAGSA